MKLRLNSNAFRMKERSHSLSKR